MRKQKDLKIDSLQWIAAQRKILSESFIMRCMLEPSHNNLRCWTELFLINDTGDIYQIRFERFLGDTPAPSKISARKYDAPLQAFFDDLENAWVGGGIHAHLVIPKLAFAVPHRGFIRPFGSTTIVLLQTNHPVLMENYGAIHEWMYQARRGRISDHNESVWQILEPRFKKFLYQQQLKLIRDTIGEVLILGL